MGARSCASPRGHRGGDSGRGDAGARKRRWLRTHRSLTAATKKIAPATRKAGTRHAGRVSEGGSVFVGRHARRRIAGRVPLTLTGAAHANRGTLVATAHAHGHAGRHSRGAFGNLRGLRRNATSVVQSGEERARRGTTMRVDHGHCYREYTETGGTALWKARPSWQPQRRAPPQVDQRRPLRKS